MCGLQLAEQFAPLAGGLLGLRLLHLTQAQPELPLLLGLRQALLAVRLLRIRQIARSRHQVHQLRRHPRSCVGIGASHGLLAQKLGLDLVPAQRIFRTQGAAQFAQLEQVFLRARGQHLRLALVVVVQHLLHLGVVHHRRDFFRELVHVAITALQFERRLLAVLVVLRRALDVLLIHVKHCLAHLEHALERRVDFAQFGR
ncbi:hypothetical protein SDC9_98575 [bioreactor metagenome]|uniref:Uncharacterized protein n=1 Tax=bioreactor metagenome TaxID=1076179 RepID=A0A645AQF3_9ZZZZ